MNDAQRLTLIDTLANAFEKAATTCHHKRQAALKIEELLEAAGFAITHKRRTK